MNRHQQRARQATMRQSKGGISATLLQKQYAELQASNTRIQNVLFAIVKEAGRIRFSKKTLDSLTEQDSINATETLDGFVIEYKRVEAQQTAPIITQEPA